MRGTANGTVSATSSGTNGTGSKTGAGTDGTAKKRFRDRSRSSLASSVGSGTANPP